MNLSGKSFTKAQFKLLGYNLNFIPTPKNINKKTISADIKKFGRRVKLRDHFGISHTDTPAFKSESSWEPAKNHHTVETFLEDFTRKVNNELTGATDGTNRRTEARNLNKSEVEALEEI